ncbi:hypothetical protein Vretifemale_6499, partial [Volvox reticuliferus]
THSSVAAQDKAHAGDAELEASAATAKEDGELLEVSDCIAAGTRLPGAALPPLPSPRPLSPAPPPPPPSTAAVLTEANGAGTRDSNAYGSLPAGGSTGGSSINSWSQWEEGGALAVD